MLFLQLVMAERDKADPFTERLKNEFGFKIAYLRAKAHNVSMTPQLLVWLVVNGSNPAHLVMWVYTMAVLQHEKKAKVLTMENWTDAFPDGVATDEEFSRVWLEQKMTREDRDGGMTDNWLDTGAVWPVLPAKE